MGSTGGTHGRKPAEPFGQGRLKFWQLLDDNFVRGMGSWLLHKQSLTLNHIFFPKRHGANLFRGCCHGYSGLAIPCSVGECLVASLYFGEREGFFVLKILLTFDSLSPREHFEIGKD